MDIRAKKIILKAKKQVFSGMLGNNSSLFKGQGFDFMELRQYQEYDDVKHIDWITTAKKNTPYVKVFHEQRQLQIALLPLLTGSLYFGTKGLKYEQLARVCAILGFVAMKNSDCCTALEYSTTSYKKQRPIKNSFALHQYLTDLLEFNYLQHKIDPTHLSKLKLRPSLLFVLGDFVGNYDLSKLSAKHDVVAIIIRDRFEKDPQPLGIIDAIDPVYGSKAQLNCDNEFTKNYKAKMAENDRKLITHFQKYGIRHLTIYSDEDPYKKLLQNF